MKIGSKINRAPLRRQGIVKFTRSRNAFVSIRAIEKNFNIKKRASTVGSLMPLSSHRYIISLHSSLVAHHIARWTSSFNFWLSKLFTAFAAFTLCGCLYFDLLSRMKKKICSNWGFESLLLFKCRSYDIQHFLHSIRECFIVGWEKKLRRSRRTARNFSEKK